LPSVLWSELEGQPDAVRTLARFYLEGEGRSLLDAIPRAPDLTFTGMGASYHVAWICALHLNSLGIPARHIEATDLLNYTAPSLGEGAPLVCFSQSGAAPS
jgi:fructoselysine-6-P-deglycase FrlB-like protein